MHVHCCPDLGFHIEEIEMTNAIANTPAIAAAIDLANPNNGRLTLTFGNGLNIYVAMGDLSPEIATQCMMHGLKQKLVDAAAISRNPDTGRSATIMDKYEAVREVYERLLAGQWNKVRDGAAVSGGLLFRALCIIYADTKTPEAIKAYLSTKTPEQKTALRKVPNIAAQIETLKAADIKTDGIDTDSLLDELND